METPTGAISPGPLIWLFAGTDLLVLSALPTPVATLIGVDGITWWWVLAQAGFSAVAVLGYVWLGTDRRRPRL